MANESDELNAPVWAGTPQTTRWGPVDGRPPGITVEGAARQAFIPWDQLQLEIETKLLPQVALIPRGSKVDLARFKGNDNWVISILDPSRTEVGNVWFGPNPDTDWKWDGLVRLGEKSGKGLESPVWQVFQRYSDGSYRRLETRYINERPRVSN